MAWRAKCYECGQDAPITRPVFATLAAHAEGDLGRATASHDPELLAVYTYVCLPDTADPRGAKGK